MKQSDSEILIEKAHNGDSASIERLMNEYKGRVKKLARAYFLVGGDSDDLIQEGMIGLFKAIRDYDIQKGKGNFTAFADMCITRNMQTAVKTALRNKHRALNESLSLNNETENEEEFINYIIDEHAANPLDVLLKDEQSRDFKAKVQNDLSKLEKKVLHEYLEGHSYSEIAARLNKSVKAVDNTLQRIKKKLIP
jgi:RNA polymerase sporulation-specific sigma factor